LTGFERRSKAEKFACYSCAELQGDETFEPYFIFKLGCCIISNMSHPELQIEPEDSIDLKAKTYFRNLFELDSAARLRLRDRVERSKGTVRFVIHPYYETYEFPEQSNRKSRLVEYSLEKMMRQNTVRNTPIIIFEEEGRLAQTQHRLAQFLGNSLAKRQANGEVYFVPTYGGQPEPKPDLEQDEEIDYEEDEKPGHWADLAIELKAARVNKIMLGGMYLMTDYYRQHPYFTDEQGRSFSGCVNGVVNWLGKSFDVEMSNLSYPANRQDTGPKLLDS
jgi:hypothetical protein